jgi:hypothetical protein
VVAAAFGCSSGGTGPAVVGGSAGVGGGAVCAPNGIRAAWNIVDPSSGLSRTCDQVPASTVVMSAGARSQGFPCTDLGGTSDPLPAGVYLVNLALTDGAGTVLFQTPDETVTVPSCGLVDAGTVDLSCAPSAIKAAWTIIQQPDGTLLSCDQVPATSVTINAGAMSQTFPCGAGLLVTDPVPAGSYPVSFTLSDAAGAVVSMTPSMDVPVQACGGADTGTVSFEVN